MRAAQKPGRKPIGTAVRTRDGRWQPMVTLAVSTTVVLLGCSSVYEPNNPNEVRARCGESPIEHDAVGVSTEQGEWNECARDADRAVAAEAADRAATAEREQRAEEQAEREQRAREEREAHARREAALEQNVAAGRNEWDARVARTRTQIEPHLTTQDLTGWDLAQEGAWQEVESDYRERAHSSAAGSELPEMVLPEPNVPEPVASALERQRASEQAQAEAEARRAQAEREQLEADAAVRRTAADRLDEWALDHGYAGDAFYTAGDHDVVLVYETVLCSRQRVHKLMKQLRSNLRKFGFKQLECENAIERVWELVDPVE